MAASRARIGVLALQGDFAAHKHMLSLLGVRACEIRHPDQLPGLAGLILPGGESTTLLKLMDQEPAWWQALPAFHRRGGALLGTCAGIIMLAYGVHGPEQRSLGLLDIDVERNAYGRQIDSFEVAARWQDGRPLEMVFIRAPRIVRTGPAVEVLASHGGNPVLVREEFVLGATFHPELGNDRSVHRFFLAMIAAANTRPARAGEPSAPVV